MLITRKTVITGVLAAAILALSAVAITFVVLEVDNINYRERDPIVIWGDEDFNVYDFPGEGTEDKPYRIEKYNITTDSNIGIDIWNTTLYFIIENCHIEANESGIWIESIAPGTAIIEKNTIIGHSKYGILIYDSPGQVLNRNTIQHNTYGIYIHTSMGCAFLDNYSTNNYYGIVLLNSPYSALSECSSTNNEFGIYIGLSSDTNIAESAFTNNGYGIYIEESVRTLLADTGITNNGFGIFIVKSNETGVGDNEISNNGCGIYMEESSHSTFEGNSLTHNDYGFYLDTGVNSSLISYNYFESNHEYAIYIELFNYDNIIHHNTFLNNSVEGTSQAYDNGVNVWYDVDSSEGNYYDDWNGIGSYAIDGIMGNEDPYPLEVRPV